VEFQEDFMTIKLSFKHASKISSNESNPNVLKATVVQSAFFERKRDGSQAKRDSSIQITLPQQIKLIPDSKQED